jgi:hypothetical protein
MPLGKYGTFVGRMISIWIVLANFVYGFPETYALRSLTLTAAMWLLCESVFFVGFFIQALRRRKANEGKEG